MDDYFDDDNTVEETTTIEEEQEEETLIPSSPCNDEDDKKDTDEASSDDGNFDEIEDSFDELVKEAEQRLDSEDETPVDITEEDLAEEISKNEDILGEGFTISRDGIIQVLDVVKRVQNKEEFNIYRALPKEVQDPINTYVAQSGAILNTPDGNRIRNGISEMLINEFIDNISLQHYVNDFKDEMNKIENKVNEEFSKMYKDYDENRNKYIEEIMENQEDPEKKVAIGAILDSINDGFSLNRIKEAAANHKIKIKKYDLENPKREFDRFLYKYQNSQQNIYSIYMARDTLYKHMKDDIEDDNDINRFFLAIAKFCLNYDVEVPTEHAFMYYAMYNAILLDVYKGDEYEDFAPRYKANVKEIIDLLKVPPEDQPNNKKQHKNK